VKNQEIKKMSHIMKILDALITSLSKLMPKFQTKTKVLILALDDEEDWDKIKVGLNHDD
jgi:hypothetical protein